MRANTLLGVSLAIAAVLVQAGCSSDSASSQDGLTPGGTATAQGGAGNAARPEADTLTLPDGTQLTVRTTIALSTNTHQAGQTFSTHLEDSLVYDGREIAPKGAEVEGLVVQADKGGRVKDRASLTIQLIALHATGGQVVEIQTNSISRDASATKGKDAAKIGIGSGIGAAVGAIAGGGKGAAIGAAAGAGAGTGVVLATTGDPAVIPSETVLVFELRSAVLVAESR
jgi:hypothetical protein